jgi:hypothetical protein
MRHFNLQRHHDFCPEVNVDQLWTLVSEDTRKTYATNKTKVPVIDVTKAVRIYRLFALIISGILQGSWTRCSSPTTRRCSSQILFQDCRKEN